MRHMQDCVEYQDGCHVWICIPKLSLIEYHPFSVTSSHLVPGWRNTLLLQPKIQNRWTKVVSEPPPPPPISTLACNESLGLVYSNKVELLLGTVFENFRLHCRSWQLQPEAVTCMK